MSANLKSSSIKTTPHNLAALITKIKGNNEVSGSAVSNNGTQQVLQQQTGVKKSLRNRRADRTLGQSLQLAHGLPPPSGQDNRVPPINNQNIFFSNNAFSGPAQGPSQGGGHQHTQSLSSRPGQNHINASLIIASSDANGPSKSNGPNKLGGASGVPPINLVQVHPNLQMPSLQHLISPKNPSHNPSSDRKLEDTKTARDQQLLQAFQQSKWRDQLS